MERGSPLAAATTVAAVPAGRSRLPARGTLLMLAPRWLAARNRARRLTPKGRAQAAFLAVIGVSFGVAVFIFFLRVLRYFLAVPDFGPVLTAKLLGMVFMTFFSVLLFSNIVTALSTFFLSSELDRLVAAPLGLRRLVRARFAGTLIDSSWMVLVFAVPAFLAYGVAHGAGPVFYAATALTVAPFLVIPAALGLAVTVVLVNVFPARRTKDILVLLSLVAVAVLYLLFRFLQPERLVNPEVFSTFVEFVAAMRMPSAPYLPSTWAVAVMTPFLGGSGGSAWFHYALLASTAAVTYLFAEAVTCRWYLSGWSKAQEGRRARLTRGPLWERSLALAAAPFVPAMRLLIVKDVKIFFRDTSQWSQLILLLALVVVYVYNFSVLPLGNNPLVTFYFTNVIAFANLALAAFVTASVAVRFVFPSFSLEGRAFWILKTAPVRMRRVWWSKFWTGLVPLLVLGEVLVVLTNSYLRVMPFMMWLSVGTLAVMVLVIVSVALAVGAEFPRFDADNAAQVAAGAGGLIYMVLCLSFIGLVVVLEAWPVYVFFMSRLHGAALTVTQWIGVVASFAAVALLSAGTFAIATRRGLSHLERLDP